MAHLRWITNSENLSIIDIFLFRAILIFFFSFQIEIKRGNPIGIFWKNFQNGFCDVVQFYFPGRLTKSLTFRCQWTGTCVWLNSDGIKIIFTKFSSTIGASKTNLKQNTKPNWVKTNESGKLWANIIKLHLKILESRLPLFWLWI